MSNHVIDRGFLEHGLDLALDPPISVLFPFNDNWHDSKTRKRRDIKAYGTMFYQN
jgi:hypothetical protein